jgi:pilus assembly protein CpaD
MTHRLLLPLCFGLVFAVAGCTPPTAEWSDLGTIPNKLRVDYVRFQHATAFAPGSAKLADGEAQSLAAFLDQAEVTPDDHVYFEVAHDDGLSASRISELSHEMSQRGIGATTLPASPSEVAADHMIVLVERYVVTPPNCPNWTKPAYGDHSNTMPSNFGCADATNLGLMVADPRDLVIGRSPGPPQGDPALAGYDRYVAGKPKVPVATSASSTYGNLGGGQ